MQIKADEKELQGLYSNLMMIHHNVEEFTLNFVYIFPNGTQGKLLSSVIVSPGHAKRIWRALGENLSRYEAQFGPIKEAPEGAARRRPSVSCSRGRRLHDTRQWLREPNRHAPVGEVVSSDAFVLELLSLFCRRACSSGG